MGRVLNDYGGWLFLQFFLQLNFFTIIFFTFFSSDSKPEWNPQSPVTEPSNLTTRLRVKTREGVVINRKSFINIDKMAAVSAAVQGF